MQPVSPQPLLSEEDYGAIEAAVMETARGRWFLAEYARRNRNADTAAVLAAIRRLERLVESAASTDSRNEVARGMASIAQAIAAAAEIPTPAGFGRASARRTSPPPSGEMVDEARVDLIVEEHEAMIAQAQSDRIAGVAEAPIDELRSNAIEDILDDVAVAETEASREPVAAAGREPVVPAPAEPISETPREVVAETSAESVADAQPETVAQASVELAVELPQDRAAQGRIEAVAAIPDAPVAGAAPEDVAAREEAALPAASPAGPFPILEIDDEAADELLAKDSQRQELKLPANRLAASRRSRLDMAALLAVPRETPEETGSAPQPSRAGMVTFVDEEPMENGESVFSAPLRLEPEEPSAREAEAQTISLSSSWTSRLPMAPRMTVAEIEAMPFKKKAALFS